MILRIAVVFGLLLSSMGAASAASWRFVSEDPVTLVGVARIVLPDARFLWDDAEGSGTVEVRVPEGIAHVWSQTQRRIVAGGEIRQAEEPAEDEPIALRDAVLRVAFSRAPASVLVLADGVPLTLNGHVDAAGVPGRYPANASTSPLPRVPQPAPLAGPMPHLVWSCEEGWAAHGRYLDGIAPTGEIVATLNGAFALEVATGLLVINTPEGPIERRLGVEVLEDAAGVQRTRQTKLLLQAQGDLQVRLVDEDNSAWAACAPTERWEIDGTARWTGATGTMRDGEQEIAFDDARFETDGPIALAVEDRGVAGLPTQFVYEGGGDASVRIDGRVVSRPDATVAAPLRALTWGAVLAALALLALQLALALYTRIHRDRALDHPRRRALYDAVCARPGIHLRELHRGLGGAWGPFSFHLRVLRDAGYLRLVRARGVTQAFPVGADLSDPATRIAHPVPRAIFSSLPADGAPMRVADLRRALGLSPQLMRHHLRALAAGGLVAVEGPAFGSKSVRRRQ